MAKYLTLRKILFYIALESLT